MIVSNCNQSTQYCLFIIHIDDVFDFLSFSFKYNNDIDKARDCEMMREQKLRQTLAEIPVKQTNKQKEHKCILYGFFFLNSKLKVYENKPKKKT